MRLGCVAQSPATTCGKRHTRRWSQTHFTPLWKRVCWLLRHLRSSCTNRRVYIQEFTDHSGVVGNGCIQIDTNFRRENTALTNQIVFYGKSAHYLRYFVTSILMTSNLTFHHCHNSSPLAVQLHANLSRNRYRNEASHCSWPGGAGRATWQDAIAANGVRQVVRADLYCCPFTDRGTTLENRGLITWGI